MLIDSHCHLDGEVFEADRAAVIQRARQAGVTQMLAIGSGEGPPDLDAGIRMAEAFPDAVCASVGVHPHSVSQIESGTYDQLVALAQHPKVVAWGEIGLDYHYDFAPREVQQAAFSAQIRLAGELRLPILIHTREAWPDTFAILERDWAPFGLPGVMHCFSGGPEEAQRSLQLGFTLSFSGIVTYPKAQNVQQACAITPLDRILVETDSPYLAPVPYRGKRNEPSYVVHTAEKVAELKKVSVIEVCSVTTENFIRLFPAASNR
jgi:TatD DNase family protein